MNSLLVISAAVLMGSIYAGVGATYAASSSHSTQLHPRSDTGRSVGTGTSGPHDLHSVDPRDSGLIFAKEVADLRGEAPTYEGHTITKHLSPKTSTVLETVTKTHTLRIPSTSDVWITSVKSVTIPVTRFSTSRAFVPSKSAGSVTSFIRK